MNYEWDGRFWVLDDGWWVMGRPPELVEGWVKFKMENGKWGFDSIGNFSARVLGDGWWMTVFVLWVVLILQGLQPVLRLVENRKQFLCRARWLQPRVRNEGDGFEWNGKFKMENGKWNEMLSTQNQWDSDPILRFQFSIFNFTSFLSWAAEAIRPIFPSFACGRR